MRVLNLFIANSQIEGRQNSEELHFDSKGVIGDKFYDKKIDRSVLITGKIAYDIAKDEGIDLKSGDLGENILVDFDTRELNSGDRLISGELILEVTRRCPICNHLSIYDPKLPRLVKDTRGVYLKVINSGILKIGDQLIIS